MNCLTEEQLAGLAIGVGNDADVSVHVDQCDECRAKLMDIRRLTQLLTTAHAEFDRSQSVSRAKLLAHLQDAEKPVPRNHPWRSIQSRLASLTIRQRVAAAGIGLSTVAGMLLLIALVMNLATPLSAMERMVNQLRAVTSFSYELEETSDRITGDNRRRILRNDTVYYVSPNSFRATTKMVKLPLPPSPGDPGELLVDVEEIYTVGQRGILIDHKAKTFFRTPEFVDEFPDYSPVNWLKRMSEGSVKVVRDLGTKPLHGKTAHGYIVSLGHPVPTSGQNAVHLWLDAATDLPIEFRYEERNEDDDASDGIEVWTNVMRVYNCRWNIELDAALFQPAEPAGYDDTTWPQDSQALAQIIEAFRLYARLSGGHYPRVTDFRGDEIQAEMLKLAGSIEPAQSEHDRQKLLQEIQDASAGLGWITRTLRNKHHTGYYGTDVGPNDKEKVLMWWPVDIEDAYRVIYGDLRTADLPLAEWSKLVPTDVAESHTPPEYAKPGTPTKSTKD
jgi:hypothetical protein